MWPNIRSFPCKSTQLLKFWVERDEEGNKLYRWGVSVSGKAQVEWLVYNKTIGNVLVDYSLRGFKFSSNIVTTVLENYNAHWEMSNQKALYDTNDDLFQVWEQSTKCPLPPIHQSILCCSVMSSEKC